MSEPSAAGSPPAGADAAGRERTALLAHLRHELRTPVNAILGYSEILLEDTRDAAPERVVSDLERVHSAGQTLLALINDLLNPSRLDQEGSHTDEFWAQARHDLRTPVNAVLGYSEMLLEDAADLGLQGLTPDIERIHSAAQKLLERIEDIVQLSEVGAGRRALDSQGRSVSEIIQGVLSAVQPTDAPRRLAEGGQVLIVDDNEINREMLSRRLGREGLSVSTAENGRIALEMIAARPFDLVLLDVLMPEMNGFEVLQRIKGDADLRHIPVIMISALDELEYVVRCIEIGAEDYLPKPFNPVLLRARIGASLEKKHLRDREVLHLREIEAQKRRADELLHVILPHEIVQELKEHNAVLPKRYDNVAVLFVDVVGFTPYCAGRDPAEVVARLQELVEAYEDLALENGLQKIKTIGDAFMATAGAIREVPDPVLRAVRCGLGMVETARALPSRWDVRVGIHVGPVTAGVVGHRQYLFDIWGDTVNTAARVESNGRKASVNLSAAAWATVQDVCTGESLGPIHLKGLGEMEVFAVTGLR